MSADEQPTVAVDPADAPVEYGVRSWGPLVSGEVRAFGDRDAALAELRHRQRMWPTESHHLMHRRVSPWQRVGGPLPDLVVPPAPAPEVPSLVCLDETEQAGPALSPDCRDGKCTACVGEAWDEHDEAVTDCEHACHEAACVRCNPTDPTPHRPHTCADRGPYGTTCTEDPGHRYSHYDAGDDSSWQDDWREGCDRGHVPPDGRP